MPSPGTTPDDRGRRIAAAGGSVKTRFALTTLVVGWLLVACEALAVVIDVPISGVNDDAEERVSSGTINRTSSDLELVFEGGNQQVVGVRFASVPIPSGATVNSAYIQFTVDEVDTGVANVVIAGELAADGDADAFSAIANDISDRTPTSQTENWAIPPWSSVGAAGVDQRTPDLSLIVSEIIGAPAWADGQAMAFLFEAGAGCASSACQRTAESFSGGEARLVIDYTISLAGGAELELSMSDDPDPVSVGGSFAYTLNVANAGALAATSVVLNDIPPVGATIVSASASQGSCVVGATITCLLGDIAVGADATVIIAASIGSSGLYTNSATVTADQSDPVPANNSAVETTSVTANTNQVCYLVADSGGGSGGDDLLTIADTADFDPATNETSVGTGTGTFNIEAIAWDGANSVLYAANGNRLGVINTVSGIFQGRLNTFGTGGDGAGNTVTFSDVDALAYDAAAGILYGVESEPGNDVLFQINTATGQFVPDAFGLNVDYVVVPAVLGNAITDDIAIDPTTGVLYASINSGGSTDRLITIDKATGATSDIAEITVQDIEGLGTDPTGQLWGTSGTAEILYEIDKNTGVGSFGRSIDNGSDYEAVDCFAISPSVVNDVAVAKTVDESAPLVAASVNYTVTATNTGSGTVTALQIEDVLPGGVTFVAATPSQGIYDDTNGVWFVGTVGAGDAASLAIEVTVDANAVGTVLTNTAALLSMTQTDTDATNDTESVDITVSGIEVTKAALTISDPLGSTNAKAIPGASVRYTISVVNRTPLMMDANSMVLVDTLPPSIAFETGGGSVSVTNNPVVSGITLSYLGLSSGTDDVDFSADGGATWTYAPSDSGDGTDPGVTHIRFRPQGSLNAASGPVEPGFTIEMLGRVR